MHWTLIVLAAVLFFVLAFPRDRHAHVPDAIHTQPPAAVDLVQTVTPSVGANWEVFSPGARVIVWRSGARGRARTRYVVGRGI